MSNREIAFFLLLYGIGGLATLGAFYRSSERVKPRHLVYALIWPVWWICVKGFGQTLDAYCCSFWGSDNRVSATFGLGLFTTGYYLATHWDNCTLVAQCVGVGMQSIGVGFAPISAVYWTWVLAKFV